MEENSRRCVHSGSELSEQEHVGWDAHEGHCFEEEDLSSQCNLLVRNIVAYR